MDLQYARHAAGGQTAGGALTLWSGRVRFDLSWPAHLENVLRHARMMNAVRRLRPARILEIGSGTGSLAVFLSYCSSEVVSIDLSADVLERAERNNRRLRGRAHFRLGDAFALREFADRSFDVAVSQGFFEHCSDDEIIALLHRQLRVACHVVFSMPVRSPGRQNGGDERLMTREKWDALLLGAGFEVVESCDYRPLSRSRLLSFGRGDSKAMYVATIRQQRNSPRRLSIVRPREIADDAECTVQARAA